MAARIGQLLSRTTLPAFDRCAHVPAVTQRHRHLLLCLVAGLAATACRPGHRSRLTADDMAGRWVIDFIGYTGARGVPHYLGVEPHDTLTIFGDGRWRNSGNSTRYTIRHDSLLFPADTGETAYAVRLIGPGEPRLSLLRRATYDFNGDGLPEWAVQETVFRRVGQGATSRTP
jgi:hypothetical protein